MELQTKLRNLAKLSLVAAGVGVAGVACSTDKTTPGSSADDVKKNTKEELGTYGVEEAKLYEFIKVETYLKDGKGKPVSATEKFDTNGKVNDAVQKQYALIFPEVALDRTKGLKGLILECAEQGFGRANKGVVSPELYSEYAFYMLQASKSLDAFNKNLDLDAKAYEAKVKEINELVDKLEVKDAVDMPKVFKPCSDDKGGDRLTSDASAGSFSIDEVKTKTGDSYKKAMNALHKELLAKQIAYEKALSIKNAERSKENKGDKDKPKK